MVKINRDVANDLLSIIRDADSGSKITLDKEFLDDLVNDPEASKLLNYTVKVKSRGEHTYDGQFVDYTFKFKSPEGIKSEVTTEMCLSVGFNLHDDMDLSPKVKVKFTYYKDSGKLYESVTQELSGINISDSDAIEKIGKGIHKEMVFTFRATQGDMLNQRLVTSV